MEQNYVTVTLCIKIMCLYCTVSEIWCVFCPQSRRFYIHRCIWRPRWGWHRSNFKTFFGSRKLEFRLRYPTFSLFNTVPASDRRTNGHDRSHFLPRLANAVDKHPVVKFYSTMSAIVFCSLAADWLMWWAVRFYCCTKCVCPLTCHCIMDEAITIRWASAEEYIIYNCCWHRVVMNI